MLEIAEIGRAGELAQWEREWQGLLDRTNSNVVFLVYPWVSTWLKHFWADKPILFLFVKKGDDLVGLAPFIVDEERGCLAFPVNDYAEYCDLICAGEDEEVLEAIVGHLKSRFARLDWNLRRMPKASEVQRALPSVLARHGLIHICRESWPSPFLKSEPSGRHYMGSRHHAKGMRRRRRRIEEAGRVEFCRYTSPEQCSGAMEEVLHIERNSWKEQNGTSFTAVPGVKEFYTELASRCAERDMLCMYTVRLASEPIAYVYGIRWGTTYYALKTSYCESQKGLSPGVVLVDHCVRDALESGMTEFNFLGDQARWKNELASGAREYVQMTVCPRTVASVVRQCVEHHIKPFIRARLPMAVAAKRRLQNVLGLTTLADSDADYHHHQRAEGRSS